MQAAINPSQLRHASSIDAYVLNNESQYRFRPFSAIAENGRNSRNQYSETKLVVSRAHVDRVWPTRLYGLRVHVYGTYAYTVFKLKRTL